MAALTALIVLDKLEFFGIMGAVPHSVPGGPLIYSFPPRSTSGLLLAGLHKAGISW